MFNYDNILITVLPFKLLFAHTHTYIHTIQHIYIYIYIYINK